MWSKNQYTGDSFEIEVAFKVTGQGRVGADGMVSVIRTVSNVTSSIIEGPIFML